MRAKVVEISWHETQPVYSADFQPLPPYQLKKILNIPSTTSISTSSSAPTLQHGSTAIHSPSPSTPSLTHAIPVGTASPSSSVAGSHNGPVNTNAEAGPSTHTQPQSPSPAPASTSLAPSTSSSSDNGTGIGLARSASSSVQIPVGGSGSGVGSGSGSGGMIGTRQYRLATAGADGNVRIWLIYPNVAITPPAPVPASVIPSSNASSSTQSITSTSATSIAAAATTAPASIIPGLEPPAPHPPRAVYLSTLTRHMGSVNVVRWSPNGQTLASAGDDGNLILWVQSDTPITNFGDDRPDEYADKEYWRAQRSINVTNQAIYDIAWSPDGKYIIAGSTDNLAQVFSVADGSTVHQIQNHSHYVQGVAWDPMNEYLATQSSDRTVQVHSVTSKNSTLTIHPTAREKHSKPVSHATMEIRGSRAPSFNSLRPSMARRSSTTSDAGSAITMASELNADLGSVAMTPSLSSSTALPSTPMSNMNPPSNRPSSRRSSFSSVAPGSPLLSASNNFRNGRSPSPAPLPAIRPAPLTAQSINQKLYGDELATNFFRRLTFSPDGGLLLTPAGQIDDAVFTLPASSEDELSTGSIPRPKAGGGESKSTVYIYSRANLAKPPIAHLPGHKTTTVAVRFSPIFYELRAISGPQGPPKDIILDKSNPVPVSVSIGGTTSSAETAEGAAAPPSLFAMPYRLMYAVASQDAVLLYDTQQAGPIAIFKGLHYSAFTDIAWSPTGDSLLLSSSDGYCSIVVFDTAELGAVYPIQQHQRQLQAIVQSHSIPHPASTPGTVSHPPSPAISHSRPIPLPSRMDRESSVSSMSTTTTEQYIPGGSIAPTPPQSVSAGMVIGDMSAPLSKGPPEIYGFPVGDAPTIQPSIAGSSKASTPVPEAIRTDSADGKRKAVDDIEGEEGAASLPVKKRKVEIVEID